MLGGGGPTPPQRLHHMLGGGGWREGRPPPWKRCAPAPTESCTSSQARSSSSVGVPFALARISKEVRRHHRVEDGHDDVGQVSPHPIVRGAVARAQQLVEELRDFRVFVGVTQLVDLVSSTLNLPANVLNSWFRSYKASVSVSGATKVPTTLTPWISPSCCSRIAAGMPSTTSAGQMALILASFT